MTVPRPASEHAREIETIRVKDLEHAVSCAIFTGSITCNCGAVVNAVKKNPGGSA